VKSFYITDDHVDAVVALCTVGLDLPEDAAEADALVGRLLDPPTGRRTVRIGISTDDAGDGSATLAGVVFASMNDREPAAGHLDLLVVHPGVRRQGLGRALVAAAEDALARLGATEVRLSGNSPCYLWPGVDVRYTPAVCMAQSLGYEQVNAGWNMTADLTDTDPYGVADAEELRLAEAGVTVRRATRDDLPVLAEWVRRTWNASWEWESTQAVLRPEAGCYVAWRDGQPLAFASYGANRPSWFGPMGTDPNAERLGMGRVLLRRCLADQEAAGLPEAQIGWAGPIGFYSRAVGARLERVFWLYRRVLPDAPGQG